MTLPHRLFHAEQPRLFGRVAVKCEFSSTEYTCDDRDLNRICASAA